MDLHNCTLCPRQCGVDRYNGTGFCGEKAVIRAAKAYLHMWEEPCISGTNGSGTVFFSGCCLKCKFCQNYKISCEGHGKEITIDRLAQIFLELQEKGVECNLEDIAHDIEERDTRDMNREIAPLKQAEDAVLVDSSDMTIDEVVDKICQLVQEKKENK